ncbi:MAG: acetolactate synthase [Candidatus Bathyarchaeota archaeon]|nr:acetolactate synthase [Candidatus Bathyarchaeota archaeon]
MPITQVSVFLDNHPGSLFDVMSRLDQNKMKVFALSIAEAGEFGLVRLITEEPEKAAKFLEDADFNLAKSKKNTEVTAIFITAQETLSKITKILGDGGINIEYAYSSAVHADGKVALILRPSSIEKAEQMLTANGVAILSLGEIKKYFQ